jgi:hypothetical protein
MFAPPESRRLLLFATGFGVIVITAVLSVEGATGVYFTVIGLWLGTVAVLLVLHRKKKWREESSALLAAMGIFTVALITVVYGVNSYARQFREIYLSFRMKELKRFAPIDNFRVGIEVPRCARMGSSSSRMPALVGW